MKALSFILAALFFANSAMAAVLVPAYKSGEPYIMISLQALDPKDPEVVGIFEFRPDYSSRNSRGEYKFQRGLLYKTTLTSLRKWVSENFTSGLSEDQARQLMVAMTDTTHKAKNNLAGMFLTALAGPIFPVIFWGAGLGKSLSASHMHDRLTTYTHPFSLLIISNEMHDSDGRLTMRLATYDEKFVANLEQELNAYVGGKTVSPAEERVKELLKKEEEKKHEAEQRRQNQITDPSGP